MFTGDLPPGKTISDLHLSLTLVFPMSIFFPLCVVPHLIYTPHSRLC